MLEELDELAQTYVGKPEWEAFYRIKQTQELPATVWLQFGSDVRCAGTP